MGDHCSCATCAAAAVCAECEEFIPDTETRYYLPEDEDRRFWMNLPAILGPLCERCYDRRVNDEPPDPDGEAFRGGEAASYEADQQARIQRELK